MQLVTIAVKNLTGGMREQLPPQTKGIVIMLATLRAWRQRLEWLGQSTQMTSSSDVADILDAVSKITGVTSTELVSRRRQKEYVRARHIAIQLMIEMTDLSYVQIGSALNKDCLLYTSPSPRDGLLSRMPSSA